MYRGMKLISFVDNHDVTRIASNLTNPSHLPLAYGILMGMPGIPCIYYGSEWGMEGKKEHGDDALRPAVDAPQWTALTEFIARAAKAHRESRALTYGDFNVLHLTNKQLIFERCADGERVLVMINADGEGYTAHYNANAGCGTDLLTGNHFDFGAGSYLEPYSVKYIKVQ